MEPSFITAAFLLLFISLIFISFRLLTKPAHQNLPPGSLGWPLLGESLEILRANVEGWPDKFVRDRVEKYDSTVFKTSLFGDHIIFLCGPTGNKFLFSNEGKQVAIWWPYSVRQLMGQSLLSLTGDEAKARKKLLMAGYFNTDSLKKSVHAMDEITRRYLDTHWHGKEEVQVYSSIRLYTFELACKLFMSITSTELITRLVHQFHVFLLGMAGFPLNIPGFRFYRGLRAANEIRRELCVLIGQRREELEKKIASPTQDIMSYLLVHADENGKLVPEAEIIDNILLLLFAGHDTSNSVISALMKYLAELPRVHERVLQEQREIAASKEPGELLNWNDLQRMKYSSNVIAEVMRMAPPSTGSFREALQDITLEGYTIPKGWKLCWSAAYTHKDPSCYPNATNFDESRFEGTGPVPFAYVPFGGGPRMCLGKEFARFDILVFLYNLVIRFDWELLVPNEKLVYDPLVCPEKGLPVRLRPRDFDLTNTSL